MNKCSVSSSYAGFTKYLPATNTKPARIAVTIGAQSFGQVTYSSELNSDDNHKRAIQHALHAGNIAGDWRGAEQFGGGSYIWVRECEAL